jgi:(1->4)-alpha-D-glucan 1-alpha-D-glucosylmutase
VRHLPAPGKPVPVSTYRIQLRPPGKDHPGFGFADAAAIAPYLADLGVTHLYCSPYLQAAPGSAHGYDVVDHSRLNAELGGEDAFATMVRACREAGLGILLDVVPNHMAVSEPESQNAQWWSLLRDGRDSPYADWFDVDWRSADNPGKVLVPVLGGPLGEVVDELELLEDRIRYYDHEMPIAPGTRVDGDVLATLERQHYRLSSWRVAGEELNYRRFFDVTTLAGVRVEVPAVFHSTHALVLQQVRDGVLDGLRIDHPDGLADPAGYLDRLAEATGGAWVVVEKILEPGEELPDAWATAGTTGYDALNRVPACSWTRRVSCR